MVVFSWALNGSCSESIRTRPRPTTSNQGKFRQPQAPDRFWNKDEQRKSQLVFIGRELDEAKIRKGFEGCLA